MRLAEHKDLKTEIKSLPEKEKDKLLLRLIAKDKVLTEHLHFILLESEADLAERTERLATAINSGLSELTSKKYNSRDTLLTMRKLVGSINHHFKVTKHTISDLELRIQLLQGVPVSFNEGLFSPVYKFNEKLYIYFVKATLSVLTKFGKLHEDMQFDLKESINTILTKIHTHKTAAVAQELGIPKAL